MIDQQTTSAKSRSVVIEKEFPHAPEKIWRALTQGALLKQWLMDNDFQPTVGHDFKFRSTPVSNWDGIVDGKVLAVEPNAKLSYTWVALGLASVVTFTLTPSASGTHLRMEHSGFGADQDAAYKGANYGWQKFLGNLEGVVAALP